MLFDGWASLSQTVLMAFAAYVLIVVALRIAGQQALARMSAFDFVVTIALGSIVATIPTGAGVSLADGIGLVATFLLLQASIRWMVKTFPWGRDVVKSRPTLVLWNGVLLSERMRQVNVTEEEICAAVRKANFGALTALQAVVLENDGEWSVVPRSSAQDRSAFAGLDLPADTPVDRA